MPAIASNNRRLGVAPMMDWTDRHCRFFHRLLSPSAILYTEMVTTGAILHGDQDHLLGFNEAEHPLALQLGGSDPADLAACARIAARRGYDEINLNVGCPSDRVQKGRFGACLMREPELVRDCVRAMREAVEIPVTVKTRLGVDELDCYDYFSDFVQCVAEAGCEVFAVHARKAWLKGLSPRENREVPELRHDWVYRLKRECPELVIVLNGGVTSAEQVLSHLRQVDGVMLGRAAYHGPWLLRECEAALSGKAVPADRAAVLRAMSAYTEEQVRKGLPVRHVSRHLLGLFQGLPGARKWRNYLTENAHRDPANSQLFWQAWEFMQSAPGARRDAA